MIKQTLRMVAASMLFYAASVSLAETLIDTNGLDIKFDSSGVPESVKNSNGDELLSPAGGVYGFYIQELDNSIRRFDHITTLGNGKYRFEITGSNEKFEAVFDGANDYLTVRFTDFSGFTHLGEQLSFRLANTMNQNIQCLPLDYMVSPAETRDYVMLTRVSLWETTSMGGFALYEYISDSQEDDTLIDLWVDEGLPHPKVSGPWTRQAAQEWLNEWIETAYDASFLNIYPETLAEHEAFLPYADRMDAKGIYLFNNIWRGEYLLRYRDNDEVNPEMYPSGYSDLSSFSSTVQSDGMKLMIHYLSGNIGEEVPGLTAGTVHPDLHTWGSVTLENAVKIGDKSMIVRPAAGVELPIISSSSRPTQGPPVIPSFFDFKTFRIGGEWLAASSVVDLGNGTWRLDGVSRGMWNSSASDHGVGASAKGYLRGYNADFNPDPNSALFEQMAINWATLNNSLETNRSEFDGFEFHHATGTWAAEKYAAIVYSNLDHPTTSNTSGGRSPYAWLEYRFNQVKAALGGDFETREAVHMFLDSDGRAAPGIEDMEYELNVFLSKNNRGFSLANNNILGMPLSTLTGHGQTSEVLHLMENWKHASLSMSETQRASMDSLRSYDGARLSINGNHKWGTALWRLKGDEFSKWYAFGTDIYTHEWHSGQEHGTITPRFYMQNDDSETLVVPADLSGNLHDSRVVGRLLPRFDASSDANVNLMPYMSTGNSINVAASNVSGADVWTLTNLSTYSINPHIDLSDNRAIGLWVTGDNSGSALIIRLTGAGSRDYVVPINFSGKRWIELPTSEQGWRIRDWGYSQEARAHIDFSRISEISIGFGHVPANTNPSITVEGVTALHEIEETLVAPTITWGNHSVAIAGSIQSGEHFILDAEGIFTIYDARWHPVYAESVGSLLPTSSLDSFQIYSSSSSDVWLEIGVQATNETAVNPYASPAFVWGGQSSGAWTNSSKWQGNVVPTSGDDVVVGSMANVSSTTNNFASLLVYPGAKITFSESLLSNEIYTQGELDCSGVFRLNHSALEFGSTASLGASISWLDLNNAEINFRDGVQFRNPSMAFEHKGSNRISFKLSNSGFQTIQAGRLWDGNGATWSDVTYSIDITDYDMSSGNTLVLMDFEGHQAAFDGSFNPSVNIISGSSGLEATLAFDTSNSSLVLTVDYDTLDWDGGASDASWNSALNWDDDRVPTASDYVRVEQSVVVVDAQKEFWALDILPGAWVSFGEDLSRNDVLVQGTLDRSGGVLRLDGSTLYLEGNLSPNINWLDLGSGTMNFYEGALFGNVNLNVEHRGSNTFGFELVPSGFTPLRAGKMCSAGGADWSDITFNIDVSGYDIANGSSVELMKYSSHDSAYDGAFEPKVNVIAGDSGLVGYLNFDINHSQLMLTIGRIIEWAGGASVGDWTDAAKWASGVVPTQTDAVVVNSGDITNAQCEFTSLDIQSGASVSFAESLWQNDILVRGILDCPGVLRLGGSTLQLEGAIGANVTWLDMGGGSIDFSDGATLNNVNLHFEHRGSNTFGFKLSANGFQTLLLGKLWSGSSATWADVTYNIDISDYDLANGGTVVLMDFNSHASTYSGTFNPTVTIISGSSGLSGSLSFNTSTSQLVLTVW